MSLGVTSGYFTATNSCMCWSQPSVGRFHFIVHLLTSHNSPERVICLTVALE